MDEISPLIIIIVAFIVAIIFVGIILNASSITFDQNFIGSMFNTWKATTEPIYRFIFPG